MDLKRIVNRGKKERKKKYDRKKKETTVLVEFKNKIKTCELNESRKQDKKGYK